VTSVLNAVSAHGAKTRLTVACTGVSYSAKSAASGFNWKIRPAGMPAAVVICNLRRTGPHADSLDSGIHACLTLGSPQSAPMFDNRVQGDMLRMNTARHTLFGLLLAIALCGVRCDAAEIVSSRTSDIEGVKLHYLTAGHGPPVILLHGYAETSLMWKPVMPTLSERFTVIAPDLPGIGDSSIPADGLDMATAAVRIHALVASLGMQQAEVVGHDIGLMVAYAYAAKFPAEVRKLALMDAFLPGVEGWEPIYNNPAIWHFRFNGPTPEALVQGRERIYFEHFWNDFAADKTRSIPEADRKLYAAAYARPGRMGAGWAYFVSFQKAAKDFAGFARTKLPMPVLAIGGEKAMEMRSGARRN